MSTKKAPIEKYKHTKMARQRATKHCNIFNLSHRQSTPRAGADDIMNAANELNRLRSDEDAPTNKIIRYDTPEVNGV